MSFDTSPGVNERWCLEERRLHSWSLQFLLLLEVGGVNADGSGRALKGVGGRRSKMNSISPFCNEVLS